MASVRVIEFPPFFYNPSHKWQWAAKILGVPVVTSISTFALATRQDLSAGHRPGVSSPTEHALLWKPEIEGTARVRHRDTSQESAAEKRDRVLSF